MKYLAIIFWELDGIKRSKFDEFKRYQQITSSRTPNGFQWVKSIDFCLLIAQTRHTRMKVPRIELQKHTQHSSKLAVIKLKPAGSCANRFGPQWGP